MIFGFSSQNGTQSSETSGKIALFFMKSFIPGFLEYSVEKQNEILSIANVILRELAHIISFLCLGCSVGLFCSSQWPLQAESRLPTVFWKPFLFCVFIALIDESYQGLFVNGRTFQGIDLAKDWFGSAVGIGSVQLISINMVKKMKKNKNKLLKTY